MQSATPFIIGITGGIGSGKSVVSCLLRLMGIPVYDCDSEAKRLMTENTEIRQALIEAVGAQVYDVTGRLNRTYLASYMFGNACHVAIVNHIVHPVVRADFKQWALQAHRPVVAVESAILFEAGMESDVDSVWLVYASEHVRMQRAMQRDAATEEAIRSRMQRQQADSVYMTRADKVVYNDGAQSLIVQVGRLLHSICR